AILVARQAGDGRELWRYRGPDLCIRAVEPAGEDLAVLEIRLQPGAPKQDYSISLLDAGTGKLRWRTQLPDEASIASGLTASPIAVGETMIVVLGRTRWDQPGGRRGWSAHESIRLHALDRKNGSLTWSAPVESGGADDLVGWASIVLGPDYALVSKNT